MTDEYMLIFFTLLIWVNSFMFGVWIAKFHIHAEALDYDTKAVCNDPYCLRSMMWVCLHLGMIFRMMSIVNDYPATA